MKRPYEVLKKRLPASPEDVVSLRRRRWDKLSARLAVAGQPQTGPRSDSIRWAVEEAVFAHLGFCAKAELWPLLHRGVDQALEFFQGEWWNGHPEDRYVVDKTGAVPVSGWYQPLMDGVLLAHWSDRWDDAVRLLHWVDEDVARGASHADPHLSYHLYVVSALHRRLLAHAELKRQAQAGLRRYETLLLETTDAIASENAAAFGPAIRKTAAQFLRSEAEDVPNFVYWVTLDASLLWAFAARVGLALPSLSDLESAVIVRDPLAVAA
jgi:hypothetical protein